MSVFRWTLNNAYICFEFKENLRRGTQFRPVSMAIEIKWVETEIIVTIKNNSGDRILPSKYGYTISVGIKYPPRQYKPLTHIARWVISITYYRRWYEIKWLPHIMMLWSATRLPRSWLSNLLLEQHRQVKLGVYQQTLTLHSVYPLFPRPSLQREMKINSWSHGVVATTRDYTPTCQSGQRYETTNRLETFKDDVTQVAVGRNAHNRLQSSCSTK